MQPINVGVFDNIAQQGLDRLGERFRIGEFAGPHALMLRSTQLRIAQIVASVMAVGRAGTGTDNLPVDELSARGIPVFYAPGANAPAVADLTFAAILSAYRNIEEARAWVEANLDNPSLKKQVESVKKQFKGRGLQGMTIGLVGLGAIGILVAQRALAFGMHVIGYDPYLTREAAIKLPPEIQYERNLDRLLRTCEVISLHVSSNPQTRGMIDARRVGLMKPDAVLVNYARGDLVVNADVQNALEEGTLWRYMHDFPTGEIRHSNARATTHLGASTDDAEVACAVQVAEAFRGFFLRGEIRSANNFTNLMVEPHPDATDRLLVSHDDRPHMLQEILGALPPGCNVVGDGLSNGNGTNIGLFDVSSDPSGALEALQAIPDVHYVLHINLN